jgi:hypothetical protein
MNSGHGEREIERERRRKKIENRDRDYIWIYWHVSSEALGTSGPQGGSSSSTVAAGQTEPQRIHELETSGRKRGDTPLGYS